MISDTKEKDLNRSTGCHAQKAGEKKIVGLATPFLTDNFGTKLQAFAIQRFLDDRGVPNEIIDYRFKEKTADPRKLLLPDRKEYRKEQKRKEYLLSRDEDFLKGMQEKKKAMDRFTQENLRLSERCETLAQAGKLAQERYGTVVCGSDQVWLPSHILERYYTLSFVPEGIRRAAYAPSLGVERLPWYVKREFAGQLARFDVLTARERSGRKLIEEMTGRRCPLAADPTMLFRKEEWMNIVKERTPATGSVPYAVGYFIGESARHRRMSLETAEKNGLRMVMMPGSSSASVMERRYTDTVLYDADPFDFVKAIAGAEMVFTDSFHGAVFSLIFGKPLTCYERFDKDSRISTNTRLYSLLEEVEETDMLSESKDAGTQRTAYHIGKGAGQKLKHLKESSEELILRAAGWGRDEIL